MDTFKRLFSYSKNLRLKLLWSLLGAFFNAFGHVLIFYYAFNIIFDLKDLILSQGATELNLFNNSMFPWWKFYLLFVIAILTGIGNAIEHYLGHDVAFQVLADFRILVYEKIRDLGPASLDGHDKASLLKLMSQDIDHIEVFYAHTIVPIGRAITFAISILTMYWQLDWVLAIFITIFSLMYLLIFPRFKKAKLEESTIASSNAKNKLNSTLIEYAKGKDTIIQLGKVDASLTNLEKIQTEVEISTADKANAQKTSVDLSTNYIYFTFILFSIIFFWRLGFANNLAYLFIFPFCFEPYKSLSNLPMTLSTGIDAAKRLFAFVDQEVLIEKGTVDGKGILDKIEINNLEFAYPSRSKKVLHDFNLFMNSSDRIGIYGASGIGKSTLAKILMKWYPYENGSIKFNDIELNDLKLTYIRDNINYMPQKADFFSATLRENILLEKEDISDNYIWQILDKLDLSNRVSRLPKGLDTIMDPDNMPFSAGEKQRLDLARVLIHPADLLILDEPLSNLDAVNENIILDYIAKEYEGMVIIISHRKEAFSICNSIYKLENGSLITARG